MPPEILLKAYVLYKSEDAFRELVADCLDQVYVQAFELSRDTPYLAEEITVQVFWELARKAPRIGEEVVIAFWLQEHTCTAAAKVLRAAGRQVPHKSEKAHARATEVAETNVRAPKGLRVRVCQGVVLNMARKQSFLCLPKMPDLRWVKPMPAKLALACALMLLVLACFPLPWHRRNLIAPPLRNIQLCPSSFAQLASPEDGEPVGINPESYSQTANPSDQP